MASQGELANGHDRYVDHQHQDPCREETRCRADAGVELQDRGSDAGIRVERNRAGEQDRI